MRATKNDLRLSIAVARVTESGLPLIYLNQIGGQDELVFDGASFALNADFTVAAQLPAFEESITTLHWTRSDDGWRCTRTRGASCPRATRAITQPACWACATMSEERVSRRAARRLRRHRFALCAAMAVDALGADRSAA